jgi:hypothetical protein
MVLATSIFGAAICVLAQVENRRFLMGNTLAIALLLVLTVCIPRLVPAYRQSNTQLASPTKGAEPNKNTTLRQENSPQSSSWDVSTRLRLLRHQFIVLYPLAGSNLDTDVELRDTAAVVRYGPRAALIGFFAPFPNMWLARGAQVGLAGRLIAGAEMLLLYAVIALAGLTLVKQRRFLSVWLLWGIAAAGCIALGYVVVNISTLYRMRYAYFILIIILGMKSLLSVMPRRSEPQVELLGSAALE